MSRHQNTRVKYFQIPHCSLHLRHLSVRKMISANHCIQRRTLSQLNRMSRGIHYARMAAASEHDYALLFDFAHDQALIFDEVIINPISLTLVEPQSPSKTGFVRRCAGDFAGDQKHVVEYSMRLVMLLHMRSRAANFLERGISFEREWESLRAHEASVIGSIWM